MKKKAALIGATGLIGSNLLEILCDDSHFESVTVVVRRAIEINHPKVMVHQELYMVL